VVYYHGRGFDSRNSATFVRAPARARITESARLHLAATGRRGPLSFKGISRRTPANVDSRQGMDANEGDWAILRFFLKKNRKHKGKKKKPTPAGLGRSSDFF